MKGDLKAWQSHESRPDDDCKPATAVVAAATRMAAVEALRRCGFTGREVAECPPLSAEWSAALDEPGAVLWCDWFDRTADRVWHRV